MATEVRAWVRSIMGVGLATQFAVASAIPLTDSKMFDAEPADVQFTVVNDGTLQPADPPDPADPATITPSQPPIQSSKGDTLTFNLFDPTLGTLNSVTISFATSDLQGTATLQSAANNSSVTDALGHPLSVTFFADGALTVELTSLKFLPQVLAPGLTGSDSCAAPGVSDDPPAPGGTCSGLGKQFSGSFDSAAGGIPGLSAASFIGPGTFDVTATLSNALSPRIDPDNGSGYADNATFIGFLSSLWKGSVTVTYDYTPTNEVPEPVTLYLLLAGLGGIALSRRRRS